MKKILVDFVAYRSVVVELRDDEDDEEAIAKAENYLNVRTSIADWQYDNNIEETDNDADVKLEEL